MLAQLSTYMYAMPLLHVLANARSASHRPPGRQHTAFHSSVETDARLERLPTVAKPDAHPWDSVSVLSHHEQGVSTTVFKLLHPRETIVCMHVDRCYTHTSLIFDDLGYSLMRAAVTLNADSALVYVHNPSGT